MSDPELKTLAVLDTLVDAFDADLDQLIARYVERARPETPRAAEGVRYALVYRAWCDLGDEERASVERGRQEQHTRKLKKIAAAQLERPY